MCEFTKINENCKNANIEIVMVLVVTKKYRNHSLLFNLDHVPFFVDIIDRQFYLCSLFFPCIYEKKKKNIIKIMKY